MHPEINSLEARQEKIHNFSIDKVCDALAQERGMITHAAARLGVTVTLLRNYIGKNSVASKALLEAREAMGDVAEKKLYELIEAGDVRCIFYYLSTVHRHRGYGLKGTDPSQLGEAKQVVNTINIVSVPAGQFLTKEEIDSEKVIDSVPVHVPELPAPTSSVLD